MNDQPVVSPVQRRCVAVINAALHGSAADPVLVDRMLLITLRDALADIAADPETLGDATLTPIQRRLYATLRRSIGRPVKHGQLFVNTGCRSLGALRIHIATLRNLIDNAGTGERIEIVRSIGYMMVGGDRDKSSN